MINCFTLESISVLKAASIVAELDNNPAITISFMLPSVSDDKAAFMLALTLLCPLMIALAKA